MMDLFFANGGAWFTVPAIIGTVLLLLRLALMMIGGDAGLDADVDIADAPDSFGQFLSIQAVAAFLAGTGWAGVACLNGFKMDTIWSLLVGIGFGVALTVVQAWLFAKAMGLEGSGNVTVDETVGLTGEVTVTIPASDDGGRPGVGSGRGSVRLVVRKTQKEYAAVSTGARLARGTVVRVVEARPGPRLVVEPADGSAGSSGDTGGPGEGPAVADMSEERSDG